MGSHPPGTGSALNSLMPSILFVCTANQFRSPIAAALFSRKVEEMGEPDRWTVGSAGTWTIAGLHVHGQANNQADKLGVDLSTHKTREVTGDLLGSSDLIVVMDRNHQEALEAEFPETREKIVLLGNVVVPPLGDIADPAEEDFCHSDDIAQQIKTCIDTGFAQLIRIAAELNTKHIERE